MTDNGAGSAAAADLKKHTHKSCRIKIPVRWVGGNAQKLRRTNTIFFVLLVVVFFIFLANLQFAWLAQKIHGNFIFVSFHLNLTAQRNQGTSLFTSLDFLLPGFSFKIFIFNFFLDKRLTDLLNKKKNDRLYVPSANNEGGILSR